MTIPLFNNTADAALARHLAGFSQTWRVRMGREEASIPVVDMMVESGWYFRSPQRITCFIYLLLVQTISELLTLDCNIGSSGHSANGQLACDWQKISWAQLVATAYWKRVTSVSLALIFTMCDIAVCCLCCYRSCLRRLSRLLTYA